MGHDNDPIRYSANEQIPLSLAVLLLILPVLTFELVNRQPTKSISNIPRNTKITNLLMIGVMASNTACASIFVIRWLVCGECRVIMGSWSCSRAVLRAFNLLFLIHRAKLVQGMTPILSKKWFETIFPGIIVVATSGFLGGIINDMVTQQYDCTPFHDLDAITHCIPAKGVDEFHNHNEDGKIMAAFAIGVDAVITAFLMTLFVVPLHRVYNLSLGKLNANQLRQKEKLRDLLVWSVALVFINQVTSTLVIVPYVHYSEYTKLIGMIGQFDPAINVWTAWLMMIRNREFLQRLICRLICRSVSRAAPRPTLQQKLYKRRSRSEFSGLGIIKALELAHAQQEDSGYLERRSDVDQTRNRRSAIFYGNRTRASRASI